MTNHLKNLTLITAAFGLAGAASAQSTSQIDRPWKVELGIYVPTTDISGADEKVGGTFALGYRFLRLRDSIDLEAELRGTGFKLEGNGGDADVEISQFLVNGYYRTANSPVFFNLGLGFGQGDIKIGNVTFNDDSTDFVWQAGVGYQFQPNVYGVVRYHNGDSRGYRGLSFSAGYRF